jgi:hypothetical protein
MRVETASLSGAILLIIGYATAMAWALTLSGFSHQLAHAMSAMPGGAVRGAGGERCPSLGLHARIVTKAIAANIVQYRSSAARSALTGVLASQRLLQNSRQRCDSIRHDMGLLLEFPVFKTIEFASAQGFP